LEEGDGIAVAFFFAASLAEKEKAGRLGNDRPSVRPVAGVGWVKTKPWVWEGGFVVVAG
jgi:hypothetical protein